MLRRRTLLLLAASTPLVTVALPASAQAAQKILFIQRSKNADEVHYDARVGQDGKLDPKAPVEAYWLLKATDGSRGPIKTTDRVAYGFDVNPSSGGTHTMKLKALPARPFVLVNVNGRWRGRVQIAGKQAYMSKLYFATDDSGVMPRLLYIDIFGNEVGSGAALQERIAKT